MYCTELIQSTHGNLAELLEFYWHTACTNTRMTLQPTVDLGVIIYHCGFAAVIGLLVGYIAWCFLTE